MQVLYSEGKIGNIIYSSSYLCAIGNQAVQTCMPGPFTENRLQETYQTGLLLQCLRQLMQLLYIPKDPLQHSLTQTHTNIHIQRGLLSYHLMHKDGQMKKDKVLRDHIDDNSVTDMLMSGDDTWHS